MKIQPYSFSSTIFKVFIVFTAIFFSSILCGQNEENDEQFFWEVSHPELSEKAYLFGTFHIFDDRVFRFSDSLIIAFDNSDAFAMEIHPDSMINFVYDMIAKGDKEDFFKKYYEKNDADSLISNQQKMDSYNESQLDSVAQSIFSSKKKYFGKKDKSTFLDMYLYSVAKTREKKTYGLEDMKSQLTMLNKWSNKKKPLIPENIQQMLDSLMFESLVDKYTEQNEGKLESFLGNGMLMNSEMIRRNRIMYNSLKKMMKTETIFAGVGAAHILGDSSIQVMFEKDGYKIRKISSTISDLSDTFKPDLKEPDLELIIDTTAGLAFKFPSGYRKMLIPNAIPNEQGEIIDTINVQMYMLTDFTLMKNYVFSFHDMPIESYVDNQELFFDQIPIELSYTGFKTNSQEPISKDSVNGRRYFLTGPQGNDGIMDFYLRGNRSYKLVYLQLNYDKFSMEKDPFFNSLEFLDFKKNNIKLIPAGDNILPGFDKHKVVFDTTSVAEDVVENGVRIISVDDKSGDTYSCEVYDIKKGYFIPNHESYAKTMAEGWVLSFDTLDILLNEKTPDGIKFRLLGKDGGVNRQVYQYEYKNDKMIVKSVLGSHELLSSETYDSFMDIPVPVATDPNININDDQTDYLLSNLVSKDSTTRATSKIIFESILYDSTHIPMLKNAILNADTKLANDSTAISSILAVVASIVSNEYDTSFYSYVIDNYPQVQSITSTTINEALFHKDTTTALQVFLSEKYNTEYNYSIVNKILEDEQLFDKHFIQLMAKLNSREKTENLLYPLSYNTKEKHIQKALETYHEVLFKYFDKSVEEENATKDSLNFYNRPIAPYLHLMSTSTNLLYPEKIEQIDTSKFVDYMKQNYFISRIINDMEITEEDKEFVFSKENLSLSHLGNMISLNKESLIPDSMLTREFIHNLKFDEIRYEIDVYSDNFTFAKRVLFEKEIYDIYIVKDESEGSNACNLIYFWSKNQDPDKDIEKYIVDLKSYSQYVEDCSNIIYNEEIRKNIKDIRAYSY